MTKRQRSASDELEEKATEKVFVSQVATQMHDADEATQMHDADEEDMENEKSRLSLAEEVQDLEKELEGNEDEADDTDEAGLLDDVHPEKELVDIGVGGKLKFIHVENFMCHRKLQVSFGPKINFITGQNGSGKSAIIVALQICLGMSARQTHRGSNLAGLIRNGSTSPAIVSVGIDNTGELAYQPENYGDIIVVERVIKSSGPSKFNFRSKSGRIISSRRETLEDIVSNFNLHVDNPCCILDQENSKMFLRGDGRDKYQFFLKASMLETIRQAYAREKTARQEASKNLSSYEGSISNLRDDVEMAEARVEELKKMGLLQQKIEEVEQDIVWRGANDHLKVVESAEADLNQRKKKYESALTGLEEIVKEKDSIEEKIEPTTRESMEIEKKLEAAKEYAATCINDLENERDPILDLENQIREKKRHLKSLKVTLKNGEKELQSHLRKQAEESNMGESQEDILEQIDEKTQMIESLKGNHSENREQMEKELADEYKRKMDSEEKLKNARRESKQILVDLKNAKTELIEAEAKQQNGDARFGSKVPQLLDEIERNKNRFERIPVHVGLNVRLLNLSFWRPAESFLRRTLNSFVVHSGRDMALLKSLARKMNFNISIIISPFLNHRHNITRPTEHDLVTLESILEISHDMVFNALVDQAKIEKVAVFNSSSDAAKRIFMRRGDRYVMPENVLYGLDREGTQYQIQRGSEVISKNQSNARGPSFFTDDYTAQVKDCQRALQELQKKQDVVLRKIQKFQEDVTKYQKRYQETTKKKASLQRELNNAEDELEELKQTQAELIEKTNDRRAMRLEGKIEVVKAEITMEEGQITQLQEECASLENILPAAEKKLRDAETQVQAIDEKASKLQQSVTLLNEKYQEALALEDDTKRRIQRRLQRVNEAQQEVEKQQRQYDEIRSSALELSDGQERRPTKSLNQLYMTQEKIQKRIEAEKRRLNHTGDRTSEQLLVAAQSDLQQAQQKQQTVTMQIEIVKKRINALKRSSTIRTKLWKEFKRTMQTQCDQFYQYYLSKRNHGGALEFDDAKGEMVIKWSKVANGDSSHKQAMISDTKSLSGGERSYTTVALLLAMGKVVQTPFRVMDEFDVFMDEAIRKAAITNLIEAAKDDSKQYVFITPHNVGDAQQPGVRVQKLKPPTKDDGQTTLNFS